MQFRKYGAIDIGTNSVRLLLTTKVGNTLVNSKKFVNTTRLGSSIDENSNISIEGITRTIDAIEIFKKDADEYGCEKIFCIGTAALRNAKNSNEFVSLTKKRTGIDVEIIDGSKEAYLGYIGVIGGIDLGDDLVLIIDIGGGSTEFIFGDKKERYYKKSLNIGALLLTEKFISVMPEESEELKNLYSYINNEVANLYNEIKKSKLWDKFSSRRTIKLIGIGGTITQTSAIYQKLEKYSSEKVHLSVINKKEVVNQIEYLSKMDLKSRKNVIGLQSKRAEIIVTGELILKSIMDIFGFEEITVSEYDNLEGLVLDD